MKSKWFTGLLLLLFTLVGAIGLIAQEIVGPVDMVDFVIRFDVFVGSLGGLAVVSIWLTGLINGLFGKSKPWMKQIVSWIVPTVFALFVTYVLNIGFLVDKSIWEILIFGIGAGLVSNGIFDIGFVKAAVNWLVGKIFRKQEVDG